MSVASSQAGPERSGRVRVVACLLLAALTAALWSAAYRERFTSLWYPDACDYAQLGRQIVRGEGMTSRQSFPYVLSWLHEHGFPTAEPWPNVTRFVLPPLERAASFALLGDSDFAAVLPDAFFLVGTVLLCFLLGAELGGPSAGLAAAAIVMASPTELQYALSGLSETGAGFFLLAAAWLLARLVAGHEGQGDAAPDRCRATRDALLLGVAFGLGYLQRSNLAFGLAPALLLLLARAGRLPPAGRVRLAAACAAVTVLVASPWLLRNALAYGSPLFSLTVDRNVALALLQRDAFYDFPLISSGRVVAEHFGEVVARLGWDWIAVHWREPFGDDLCWFLPFLAVTPLLPLGRSGRAVSAYAWGTLLLSWVLSAPLVIHTETRYYQPFAPLAVVLGVSFAAVAARRVLPRAGPALVAASCVALALSWVATGFASEVLRRDPALAEWDRTIAASIGPRDVVASDQSWYVAWQADRPSVRFYGDAAQLAELEKTYTPVAALWLGAASNATFTRTMDRAGQASRWRLVHRSTDGSVLWRKQEAPVAGDFLGERPRDTNAGPGPAGAGTVLPRRTS